MKFFTPLCLMWVGATMVAAYQDAPASVSSQQHQHLHQQQQQHHSEASESMPVYNQREESQGLMASQSYASPSIKSMGGGGGGGGGGGEDYKQLQDKTSEYSKFTQIPSGSMFALSSEKGGLEFDSPFSKEPYSIVFRTHSMPVKIKQQHQAMPAPEVEYVRSQEEAHRIKHEVVRPVIQEVHEIIQPYRRVVQEVRPVIENVHTIVAKGEPRNKGGDGGAGAGAGGAMGGGGGGGQGNYGGGAGGSYGGSSGGGGGGHMRGGNGGGSSGGYGGGQMNVGYSENRPRYQQAPARPSAQRVAAPVSAYGHNSQQQQFARRGPYRRY